MGTDRPVFSGTPAVATRGPTRIAKLECLHWLLRTGARWQDIPAEIPSRSTCCRLGRYRHRWLIERTSPWIHDFLGLSGRIILSCTSAWRIWALSTWSQRGFEIAFDRKVRLPNEMPPLVGGFRWCECNEHLFIPNGVQLKAKHTKIARRVVRDHPCRVVSREAFRFWICGIVEFVRDIPWIAFVIDPTDVDYFVVIEKPSDSGVMTSMSESLKRQKVAHAVFYGKGDQCNWQQFGELL